MQFDNAVVFVGLTIENAVQEMVKVGPDDKPEWKPKYRLADILDPEFRFPPVDDDGFEMMAERGIQGMRYDEVG